MPEPALKFQFDFTYEDQKHPALQDAEGTIAPGKCIVLCGGSGCGKSTLLRCMNRLIPQFYEGTLKGFCFLQGQDTENLSLGQVGKIASSVFQDPRSQFFTLNTSTEVAFGLQNFGFSREEIQKRVQKAFETFHLQRLQNREVFALSSGERQLTAILAAWALDTDLMLLDEPTANLDFGAIRQMEDLLKQLKAQGKTLVISEHRLFYLRDIADEYWVMEEGRIVSRIPGDRMKALSPEELSQLGLRTMDLNSLIIRRENTAPEESHVLEIEDLTLQYPGQKGPILKDLSLTFQTGEAAAITGHNGCGKTSLGKSAAGLLKAGGRFLLDGKPLSRKALSSQSIFIMQEAEFQFFTNSVLGELRYGCKNWEEKKQEAEKLLKLSGLWEIRNHHPFSLSGGQMQKLVLLLACLSDKPIVILDEPTAGLDARSLEVCGDLIRRLQKTKILLVITHDLELISRVCTRNIELFQGAVLRDFPISSTEDLQKIREAMEASIPPEPREAPPKERSPRLDPRSKLFLAAIALIAGIYTDQALISCVFLAVILGALFERRFSLVAGGAILMAAVVGAYVAMPTAGMSFLAHFFPRILLMGTAALLILTPSEAPRTLAALRTLKVPEKAIMILSILFRFFPVLSGDLKIMHASMRTRGFFVTFLDKVRAIPQYLEMILVPMVFRVLRIAETLSASGETRGIDLKEKRENFISLTFGPYDVILLVLTTLLTVLGLLL